MPHNQRLAQIAERNRKLMIEQGLDPEKLLEWLELTSGMLRSNYEDIKPMLSSCDRDHRFSLIIQGDLLLDIVRRSAKPS
jgi:hypothetical protein